MVQLSAVAIGVAVALGVFFGNSAAMVFGTWWHLRQAAKQQNAASAKPAG